MEMRLLARMRTLRWVPAGAAAVALAGCGSTHAHARCAHTTGFELSLVRNRGGQPTPAAAVRWFARHGGVGGVPRGGWRLTGQNASGATLASGQSVLHAIHGSDGTWQVDSGTTCRS